MFFVVRSNDSFNFPLGLIYCYCYLPKGTPSHPPPPPTHTPSNVPCLLSFRGETALLAYEPLQLNDLMFTDRFMQKLVVHMNESALHQRNALQLPLQALPDVVRVPQGHRLRKHDVDPDEKIVAEMVGVHCLDVRDIGVVVHSHPGHLGQEVGVSPEARQHLDLFCGQATRGKSVVQMTVKSKIINHPSQGNST